MFGTILISSCTGMHIYVTWRALSTPLVKSVPKKYFLGTSLVLWILFFLGRVIGHHGAGVTAQVLEFLGMTWMAALFLIFTILLAAELLTLFGFLMQRRAPWLRGGAILAGLALAALALVQGLRPPVVTTFEVKLPGLPVAYDGTVLVGLSDLHLGNLIGDRWLAARIDQVQALKPDLVVLLGDIFEGHGVAPDKMAVAFNKLSAPMGIWAVTGNHEFHGGGNLALFEQAGFKLLRNEWAAIGPGFVIAGVDDLTAARRRGRGGDFVSKATAGRPPGATILLSHTPWQAEQAAAAGVGLMLSGHTHGGQIWPFDYLVQSRYPLLEGRYDIDGLAVIVSRGAGTWGPRMRLWSPGEILRIILRT